MISKKLDISLTQPIIFGIIILLTELTNESLFLKRSKKETKTNIRFGGNEGKRTPFVPGGRSTRD